MKNKHLFLFGGSPPFGEILGRKFANLALNDKGKVAVLFLERDGWEEYMKKYISTLEANDLVNFVYLPLSADPSKNTVDELISCTGIIIGGGETERYRDYIVDTTLGKHIQYMYEEGVPVAGFSAGALISPSNCVIPPIDTPKDEQLFLTGLGLIRDCVISVHFSKWQEEQNLLAALAQTKVSTGYGIDDDVGLYFYNETLTETEGEKLHTFAQEK